MKGGPRRISPFFIPASIINLAAGQVSIRFNARGPNLATCTACTASAHAIGEAFEIIRRGDADIMIAGGSEAAITPMGVGGFAAMRALSTRNDDPQHASRPFDKDRDGFVMGEGSGICILETLDSARRRGARDLRRARRLRPDLATPITSPASPRRRTARSASMTMALQEGGHRAAAGRLHQRARHLDADQRSDRDARRQDAVRRARLQAGDVVDQVDDRPPARRRRRPRGRHHRARDQAPDRAADDQPRQPRSGLRPRLRAAQGAPDEDPLRAVELVRLRRHQRHAADEEFEDDEAAELQRSEHEAHGIEPFASRRERPATERQE